MIEKIKSEKLKEKVKSFVAFVKTFTDDIKISNPVILSEHETVTIETYYIIIVISENLENEKPEFNASIFFRFNTKPSFAAEFILNAVSFSLFKNVNIIDVSDYIEDDTGKKYIGEDATKYLEKLFKIHKVGMTEKAMDQLLENVDPLKIPSC